MTLPARTVATGSQQPPGRSSPSTSTSGAAWAFQRITARSATEPGLSVPTSPSRARVCAGRRVARSNASVSVMPAAISFDIVRGMS